MVQHAAIAVAILCMIALHTPVRSLSPGPARRPPPPTITKTRRDLLLAAATSAALARSKPAAASTATPWRAPPPRATALVTLELSVARSRTSRPLRIELYGDDAPASVAFFSALCAGTLRAPCDTALDYESTAADVCRENVGRDVGYVGSQCWRLVPGRRIDFGRVDSAFSSRIPPVLASERRPEYENGLTASSAGAVSMRRGGGAFEFTVSPSDDKKGVLAKEDLVLIGRVTKESMDFLKEIEGFPTRKDIVTVGGVPPLGDASLVRACDFTAPSRTCAQFKPLVRIVVVGVSVEPLGVLVEPLGASVEPLGASVEPRGASIEPLGASVEPLGASVEPL